MDATIYTSYGPPEVVHRKAVDKPAPRDNVVLVRVDAAGVSRGDCTARKGSPSVFAWLRASPAQEADPRDQSGRGN